MELSIIMPAYNAAATLETAVKSVQAQSYKDYELIIVDDGSKDETGKIADGLAASDTRIRVVHQQNKGGYGARLTGLRMMRGEYFGFIDSDDVMHPAFCKKMMALAKSEDLDIVQCDINAMGWTHNDRDNEFFLMKESVYQNIVYPHLIQGVGAEVLWDKIYRRTEAVDKLVDAPIFNFDDLVMNWQLFASVSRVGYLHELLYSYTNNVKRYSAKKTADFLWTIGFRRKYACVYGLRGDEPIFDHWIVLNACNFINLAMESNLDSLSMRVSFVRSIVAAESIAQAVMRMRKANPADETLSRYRSLVGANIPLSTMRFATKRAIKDWLSTLKRRMVK